MSQHCLKIVIEMIQGLTKIKIPKSFDQLMSVIEQDALSFEKVWFCQTEGCLKFGEKVKLDFSKQRNCTECSKK
jgi:hypothetical protein